MVERFLKKFLAAQVDGFDAQLLHGAFALGAQDMLDAVNEGAGSVVGDAGEGGVHVAFGHSQEAQGTLASFKADWDAQLRDFAKVHEHGEFAPVYELAAVVVVELGIVVDAGCFKAVIFVEFALNGGRLWRVGGGAAKCGEFSQVVLDIGAGLALGIGKALVDSAEARLFLVNYDATGGEALCEYLIAEAFPDVVRGGAHQHGEADVFDVVGALALGDVEEVAGIIELAEDSDHVRIVAFDEGGKLLYEEDHGGVGVSGVTVRDVRGCEGELPDDGFLGGHVGAEVEPAHQFLKVRVIVLEKPQGGLGETHAASFAGCWRPHQQQVDVREYGVLVLAEPDTALQSGSHHGVVAPLNIAIRALQVAEIVKPVL